MYGLEGCSTCAPHINFFSCTPSACFFWEGASYNAAGNDSSNLSCCISSADPDELQKPFSFLRFWCLLILFIWLWLSDQGKHNGRSCEISPAYCPWECKQHLIIYSLFVYSFARQAVCWGPFIRVCLKYAGYSTAIEQSAKYAKLFNTYLRISTLWV